MAELDTEIETTEATETEEVVEAESTVDSNEFARLKAELAKQKAALDKATKEAGDYRKQLRAKQSAEEVAAEEAKALQQTMQEELEQLRKEKAVSVISAKVASVFGKDADASQIGEDLYGAADADAAIDALAKAWSAREKALRAEYGRIGKPGVGASDGPTYTKEQLDEMRYIDRVKFASEHPEEYNKIMGR